MKIVQMIVLEVNLQTKASSRTGNFFQTSLLEIIYSMNLSPYSSCWEIWSLSHHAIFTFYRYNTGTSVVVHRAKTLKHGGRELQLPSMSLLTSKNSSQQFLLRILKVVIQLREAARQANRKPKRGRLLLLISME